MPMFSTDNWCNRTISMKTHDSDSFDNYWDEIDSFASQILQANYKPADTDKLAREQKHLTKNQQEDLAKLLREFSKLFSGELGKYQGQKVHLEVEKHAKPKHARPYSVPHTQMNLFKQELMRLVDIGVLRPIGATEWASPTFIRPKKDNTVRWLTDFRELNKVLKRRVYPLPNIQEVLTKRSGYEFFSKLDISMCYYTFELDEESQELCTIITPFGKFCYNRLAMGLTCSPDICQELMENIFRDIEDSDVFIDDIGAFSTCWKSHLKLLHKILQRLQDNGFTVNPRKCEWGVKETDYLGYWLTPTGLKPWKKKIDAILKMDRPRNIKQLRSFLGAVNFYRDMWPRRSHVLKPLTELTGKGQFVWDPNPNDPVHTKAFEAMKALIAADAFCAYPDHTKPFEVYTDSSDYQLGAAIMQKGKPVAYYSRKLTKAQQNYSTYEKELLAIYATLVTFRTMLLGTEITVYTDHQNHIYDKIRNRRVLNWRLELEDFAPKLVYLPGKYNVLADCFSRLPRIEGKDEGESSEVESKFHSILDNQELAECFTNFPFDHNSAPFDSFVNFPSDNIRNPMDLKWIQEHQFEDKELNRIHQSNPNQYVTKFIDDYAMICYRKDPLVPEHEWKICIPSLLLGDMIRWNHVLLGHCGATRLYDSIRVMFYHPRLKNRVDTYNCKTCQKYKQQGRSHGHLPEREALLLPFEEVHIDLIGPWKVTVSGREIEVLALTCIEPVTNLVELIRINNKTAEHVAQQFENCWLSRYPWPTKAIHDNGGEFTGYPFQKLLEQANIKSTPTSPYTPTANSICERMHQTVGNVLRTIFHGTNITSIEQAHQFIDNSLYTAMHAIRAATSRALNNNSPGSLVFNRHMFLNIPLEADLLALQNMRQRKIQINLIKQNKKRWNYDYKVGQKVLIKNKGHRKMEAPTEGPFTIVQVYTNGTVALQRRNNVLERINIRRLSPFKE